MTSWKNNFGEQQLFVSRKASFKPPKAIRGGIQICFPQLGNHGVLEQHGFARNRLWSVDESPPFLDTTFDCHIDLILKQSEEDLKIWPHSYELRLQVALSPTGDLILISRIKNNNADCKPFQFSFAYHTSFSVSDISEVRVEGLDTLDYLDNLRSKMRCNEQGDAVVFESEVDSLYLSAPRKIVTIDHEKKRTLVLRKKELPDVVVWNPWDKKAKVMPDFGAEEYNCMLCVGAACIEKPITLRPGEEWQGRQEISSVPSSYSSGQLDPEIIRQMQRI